MLSSYDHHYYELTPDAIFCSKETELHILFNNACVQMTLFLPINSGTDPLLRGVMAPPPDVLTAEGYDMTFGTSVLGWPIYIVSHRGGIDILNCRTLLLHGVTHPCLTRSFHPRTQVPSCQPFLTNGNPRSLTLWFWARFLNLQGLTDEEKDVGYWVI